MIKTIQVDVSTNKAQALLDFLLTLDFVREIESEDYILSEEQINILEERRGNHLSGISKSYTWEEVKNALGKNKGESEL